MTDSVTALTGERWLMQDYTERHARGAPGQRPVWYISPSGERKLVHRSIRVATQRSPIEDRLDLYVLRYDHIGGERTTEIWRSGAWCPIPEMEHAGEPTLSITGVEMFGAEIGSHLDELLKLVAALDGQNG